MPLPVFNQSLHSAHKPLTVYFFVFLCIILEIGAVDASVLKVPGEYPSIQDAINRANSGDTIMVSSGNYTLFFKNIVIPEKIVLNIKSVDGPVNTVIVGRGDAPAITIGEDSKVVIDGFTITMQGDLENGVMGGAIFCAAGSAPVIRHNIIVGNRATFGAGVYCDTQSMPQIIENLFLSNKAKVSGGAIFTDHARGVISRNRFHLNRAGNSGGAIGCNRGSSKITNNIFWKNEAVFGGAISCDRAASIIDNNTMVANKAHAGGAILVEKGSVRLTNLIFWENSKGGLELRANGPAERPSYSDLQESIYKGINGNISVDPMFVDQALGDFHLKPNSPCIDKGSNDPFYTDRDGSYNDMGAYGGPNPIDDSQIPHYHRMPR